MGACDDYSTWLRRNSRYTLLSLGLGIRLHEQNHYPFTTLHRPHVKTTNQAAAAPPIHLGWKCFMWIFGQRTCENSPRKEHLEVSHANERFVYRFVEKHCKFSLAFDWAIESKFLPIFKQGRKWTNFERQVDHEAAGWTARWIACRNSYYSSWGNYKSQTRWRISDNSMCVVPSGLQHGL